MTKIIWATPPAAKAGRHVGSSSSHYAPVATALRAKPGKWAKVRSDAPKPTDASRIRSGVIACFRPAGTFEATSRSTAEGFDIYARFVGEQA